MLEILICTKLTPSGTQGTISPLDLLFSFSRLRPSEHAALPTQLTARKWRVQQSRTLNYLLADTGSGGVANDVDFNFESLLHWPQVKKHTPSPRGEWPGVWMFPLFQFPHPAVSSRKIFSVWLSFPCSTLGTDLICTPPRMFAE